MLRDIAVAGAGGAILGVIGWLVGRAPTWWRRMRLRRLWARRIADFCQEFAVDELLEQYAGTSEEAAQALIDAQARPLAKRCARCISEMDMPLILSGVSSSKRVEHFSRLSEGMLYDYMQGPSAFPSSIEREYTRMLSSLFLEWSERIETFS